MNNKIILILGPTSSGKSLISLKLAKYINSEIISADSIQIYKNIDILSGKLNLNERENIIHHMIDIIEPNEMFSVFKYIEMVKKIIEMIMNKNKIPIITGGTGLYTKVLIHNQIMPINKDIKQRIININKIYGNKFLFNWLNNLDNNFKQKKYHYNNNRRIARELEKFYNNIHNNFTTNNNDIFSNTEFIKFILLPMDRKFLYKKIENRVDNMYKSGLLNEVKNLFLNYDISETAKQAIGYKELIPYLQKKSDIDTCINNIKIKSRNYAKRQITWFKNQEKSNFIYYNSDNDIEQILKKIIYKCKEKKIIA